jgi:hydroxymethylglutaryl-CoA reductase (NADPH)
LFPTTFPQVKQRTGIIIDFTGVDNEMNKILKGRKQKPKREFTLELQDHLVKNYKLASVLISKNEELELDLNIIKGRCDNWFGWLKTPLGLAGPLHIDGTECFMPMSTTEGALVASICRGCKALDNVTTLLYDDKISRGPVFELADLNSYEIVNQYLKENFELIRVEFERGSRFCKLKNINVQPFGHYLYLRFEASSGNAMGMNMVSICTQLACDFIAKNLEGTLSLISLSGNFCIDKKASFLNLHRGRGKSVIAEGLVPIERVREILKVDPDRLLKVFQTKCYYGSCLAGSVGGNNGQASNIVASIFLATGQDLAQIVESSNCFLAMEKFHKDGKFYLRTSVTMPSLEVATVGGGTCLPCQKSCLHIALEKDLELGNSAEILARRIAGFVLAGELSLLASLTEGSLVESHVKLNRL